MKKKVMLFILAVSVLSAICTGCGAKEDETSSKPLTVDVTQGDVTYYDKEEKATGLAPKTPLTLSGQNFGKVLLNGSKFNFGEIKTVEEFFEAGNVTVVPNDTFDYECDDFKFHGFALKASDIVMYAEFTKDGELVTEWNEADISNYKLKAIYTSAEILRGNNSYISLAVHILCGLSEKDILTTDGNGYTSKYDNNMVFYPDERGNTIALNYVTYLDLADEEDMISSGTDSDKEPVRYLSEIFFFKAP